MLSVKWDDLRLARKFSALEQKQLPFATANALNDALFDVRDDWKDNIGQVFDRPTALTQNAVLVKKATKRELVAEVFLRNEASKGTPPSRYLFPQAAGGNRFQKPFEQLLFRAGVIGKDEFVVPARGFPLDAAGNIPRGIVTAILSDLQAMRDALDRSNQASKRRRARKGKAIYFLADPTRLTGFGAPQHLPRGIYQRVGFGFGSSVRMVFAIVKGAPRYSVRFKALEIATRAFHKSFPGRFEARLAEAVRNARI